jgi:putative component of membrane protein insertase Oxa1/YidC/SpoIIIJ protein YidD
MDDDGPNGRKMDIFRLFIFVALLCFTNVAFADPWGKDADLVCVKSGPCVKSRCHTPLLGQFAETMIAFHQDVISPADGPRSHYLPSSSQYTLNAMRKYGFYKGFIMGCDRLMRENEELWVYPTQVDAKGYTMKLDPVP